jgi:hypothetical protein
VCIRVRLTEGKKSLNDWALIKLKCMPQNIQVNGSLQASLRPSQVPPTCSSLPPFETMTRYWAISLSSSVSHRVFSGQSGRVKKAMIPTSILIAPSIIKNHCQLSVVCQRVIFRCVTRVQGIGKGLTYLKSPATPPIC